MVTRKQILKFILEDHEEVDGVLIIPDIDNIIVDLKARFGSNDIIGGHYENEDHHPYSILVIDYASKGLDRCAMFAYRRSI